MSDTNGADVTGVESRMTRRTVLQAGAGALAIGIVSGHGVAQATGPTVYVGSADTNVYALDGASGEEVWHFETDDVIRSSPTVVADPENGDIVLEHDANDGTTDDENDETESMNGDDGSGPGFGLEAALASLGGAGYLLNRRFNHETESS